MNRNPELQDDPLDELFNAAASPAPAAPRAPVREVPETYKPANFEACRKCGGSGVYRGFGQCFSCKGKGGKSFKTDAATRARTRQTTATRKARTLAEKLEAFKAEHPAELAWLEKAAARGFRVAGEILAALNQYGDLLDSKMATIQRFMAQDAARDVERAARVEAAPAVADCAKLIEAFAKARNGAAQDGDFIRWLTLRLDTFQFADAPARGEYAAAIFVREGESKLGRIVGGKFLRSRACSDDQAARILAAVADPAAAARAYGLKFKFCSCCGRELTNAESRARGIGPICAERFGF